MEGQRKRKRADSDDLPGGGDSSRRRKKEVSPTPAPTDDEVDEFYAILRRMHVAAKYFEKTRGNDKRNLTERLGTPLERETVAADESNGKLKESSVNRFPQNGVVIDLNTVPESETD